MRYSREHKAKTHDRIVRQAATSLRRGGRSNVAIAELMKQAGLTHGGFYAHFKSRDALISEAMTFAMDAISRRWRERAETAPGGSKFESIIDGYLTAEHRDRADNGCVLPALSADIARADVKTRKAFARKLEEMIAVLVEAGQHSNARGTKASAKTTTSKRRTEAIGAICTMMGAMVLARATSGNLSSDILAAGRATAIGNRAPARTQKPSGKNRRGKTPALRRKRAVGRGGTSPSSFR